MYQQFTVCVKLVSLHVVQVFCPLLTACRVVTSIDCGTSAYHPVMSDLGDHLCLDCDQVYGPYRHGDDRGLCFDFFNKDTIAPYFTS